MTLCAVARGGGSGGPTEFPVTSVNNKTGAVVLAAADLGAATTAQLNERMSSECRQALNGLDPETATLQEVIQALQL